MVQNANARKGGEAGYGADTQTEVLHLFVRRTRLLRIPRFRVLDTRGRDEKEKGENTMNLILTDEGVFNLPAEPLGKSERERVMEAGKRRITGVDVEMFMCGQCFAVQINKGEGICKSCKVLLAQREKERSNIETARYALLWALALLAFVVFVASWILATPVEK